MLYFPERLKSARKMKGYSLQDLADAMGNVITKQALNKYEAGIMKPDSEVLSAICKVLDVTSEYFTKKSKITLEEVEFRKLEKLSMKEQEKVKQKTIDFLERYFELEEFLGLENKFKNPIKVYKITSAEDVENAAIKVREEWNLGTDPLYNIVEMLEDHDIKVLQFDAHDAFSGLSTYINKRYPVIVLNDNNDIQLARRRFTALHELGHLLMNLDGFDKKEKERLCDTFAGAMLLPADVFNIEFGGKRQNVFLKELVILKEEYGISLSAIMYRAKNLHLITPNYHQFFMMKYNRDGYRQKEPGNYKGNEISNRFMQLLLRAVAEEIISTSKAAALNGQKLADFRMGLI